MPATKARTQVIGAYRNDNFNIFGISLQGRIPTWPMDDDGFTGGAALTINHERDGDWLKLVADEQILTEPQTDRTPQTTQRDRVDVLTVEGSYGRKRQAAGFELGAAGIAGLMGTGNFGGAFAQDRVHDRFGGRLLHPDPNGIAGRNEQLPDHYVTERRFAPFVGAALSASTPLAGDVLRADASVAARFALGSTGLSSVRLLASATFDPLAGTQSPLRLRLSAGFELAHFATRDPTLIRDSWYVADRSVWAPRLAVEIETAKLPRAGGVTLLAGLEATTSLAAQYEPVVTSYAGFTF